MLDCLVMLHFHIGSQITDIRKIKDAIREAGRVYAKLRGQGVPIQYLNLGGGLGVDYDGSKTTFDSSMNYSVQEYANDVVYTIKQICDEEKVPAPVLVTESGRAVTAYHSVFVTNVLDVADRIEQGRRVTVSPEDPNVLQELSSIYETVNAKTLRESYHDALQYKEELFTLFNLGHLSLEDRSKGEILFWQICEKIHRDLKNLKEIPEEFEDMETMLADKYVLNFSVFQSLPDIWAIDQLFPILPIHRLHERPTELGTLADITCDSDGKIEKFIDLRDIKETLPLHALRDGEPYYIGVCLMGAYQDVLGDLHNLFGEAHEVLVTVDEQGKAAHRRRAARRVLRARARVHELRPDRDPGLPLAPAPPRRPAGRSRRTRPGRSTRSSRRSFRSTRIWRGSGEPRVAGRGSRVIVRAVAGLLFAAVAAAQSPAGLPDRELVVGVFEAPPFALKNAAGEWHGLSVDLWKALAADMGARYRLVENTPGRDPGASRRRPHGHGRGAVRRLHAAGAGHRLQPHLREHRALPRGPPPRAGPIGCSTSSARSRARARRTSSECSPC